MGVPAFYKWLVNRYPKLVVNAIEEDDSKGGPNPNGLEFDNLYLDMNGIIHPCFHPDSDAAHNLFPPTTFDQVFNSMFEYIDRLFGIVRPRKLLYLAIDGVAPRAKMNQQRSRRFITAKDNDSAEAEEKRLRDEYEMQGKVLLPMQRSQVSDSNVITPGTEFMHQLSKALQVYIRTRLKTHPAWKNIQVILSDGTVPGEGEHKIMSFIRSQRNLPGYDANTRHCLYGLDADLIMLALATHEIHFSILREDVLKVEEQKTEVDAALMSSIRNTECSLTKSRGWLKPFTTTPNEKPYQDVLKVEEQNTQVDSALSGSSIMNTESSSFYIAPKKKLPYQFLHVWILREYLELDMQINDPPKHFSFDIERIIDDFIFMCLFVGNDFLPHMPTLDIHEGAIDLLMHVYTKELKNIGGYIVDMQRVGDPHTGFIKLKRMEKFILAVGSFEEKIFKKRTEIRDRRLRRILSEMQETEEDADDELHANTEVKNLRFQPKQSGSTLTSVIMNPPAIPQKDDPSLEYAERLKNTKELKEEVRNCLKKNSDSFKNASFADKIKLGSVGYKDRYYQVKFSAQDTQDAERIRKEIVQKYVEGLCWVLLYYYCGVPSWTWYYPYYYGPFASDLKGASSGSVKFKEGVPFLPFDQLLAVLPPRSAEALPESYRELMTNEASELIAFYPDDFEVDMDGKRFLWQGICKLPFVDENQLLKSTIKLMEKLKNCEMERNKHGDDQLFVNGSNQFGSQLVSLWKGEQIAIEIENLRPGCGIGGSFRKCPVDILLHDDQTEDEILCVKFNLPRKNCINIPRLLEGVEPPEKTIYESDIVETPLWHENFSNRPPARLPSQVQYQRSMTNRERSNATNSPSASVIHKYGGSGWSRGGGGRGTTSNRYPTERFVSDDRNWRAVGSVDHNNIGMQQLRVSETAGISGMSYGRGRGRGQCRFWPHTNSTGYVQGHQPLSNSNCYNNPRITNWQNFNPSATNYISTGESRGQSTSNSNPRITNRQNFNPSATNYISTGESRGQSTSNNSNTYRSPHFRGRGKPCFRGRGNDRW